MSTHPRHRRHGAQMHITTSEFDLECNRNGALAINRPPTGVAVATRRFPIFHGPNQHLHTCTTEHAERHMLRRKTRGASSKHGDNPKVTMLRKQPLARIIGWPGRRGPPRGMHNLIVLPPQPAPQYTVLASDELGAAAAEAQLQPKEHVHLSYR